MPTNVVVKATHTAITLFKNAYRQAPRVDRIIIPMNKLGINNVLHLEETAVELRKLGFNLMLFDKVYGGRGLEISTPFPSLENDNLQFVQLSKAELAWILNTINTCLGDFAFEEDQQMYLRLQARLDEAN